MKRRVAVTGLGVACPLGNTTEALLANLLAGKSGVRAITLFDPMALPTRIAGEVDLPPELAGARDRKLSLANLAADSAMAAASRGDRPPGGDSGGGEAGLSVSLGLELFSMTDLVEYLKPGFVMPTDRLQRLEFLQVPSDRCVHDISSRYGLRQPPLTHISACAAGADAIGHAYRLIARGDRGWMIAGGTDSMLSPMGLGAFCKIRALSTSNETPEAASRPFDLRRNGFVLSEGAAFMTLESLDDARARGARIHAEIVGYGNSFDAADITAPHPEGRGAYQAMTRALDDAEIGPDAIDCVSAHATGTRLNDPVETLALKRLLGKRAHEVPICAPKSMLGHMITAAGAVETVAAILCMEAGWAHPTINLEEPEPECDLDYVPLVARRHEQDYVLCNSFGFGGQNACLVLRRYDAARG